MFATLFALACGLGSAAAQPAPIGPASDLEAKKERLLRLAPESRRASLADGQIEAGATAVSCGSWVKIIPPYYESLNSISFNGTQWEAVGGSGNTQSSLDGSTWNWHFAGYSKDLGSVRWFRSRFVAVGESGVIFSSSDGKSWAQQGSPTSNELRALATNDSRIVAVGRQGTILWSSDGVSWSSASSPTVADIFAVTYFRGRFVAIDDEGWALDSGDGVSWQKKSMLPSFPQYGGIMGLGVSDSTVVAVGYDVSLLAPYGAVVYTSADAVTWSKQQPASPTLRGAVYGGGQWIAVGDGTILQSIDAVSWASVPSPVSDRIWEVAWANNQYIAASWSGIVKTTCTGTAAPSADFTWSPATAITGQAVQFTDRSSGTPTSWFWDFGDAATSTERNPAHVFTTAGTRTVSLTAHNDGGTNSISKQITVAAGGSPPTADFTWSPTSPTAGRPIQFTDRSAGSPTSWSWLFAGQGTSTIPNPSFTFANAGTFTVTLTVANAAGGNTSSKLVTVGSAAAANTYWVPVASHTNGANGSQWRTDLGLFNSAAVAADAEIRLYASEGLKTQLVAVAPGAQVVLEDVVGLLGSSGSAAIEIRSDRALRVTSRTYNLVGNEAQCYATGTFGQNYPVLAPTDGLSNGEAAYLTQLAENAKYRTNIGLVNLGSAVASVSVGLYDGSGTLLGAYSVILGPGAWLQEPRPFYSKAGTTNVPRGYARITVTAGSGVLGFASVIDNLTNDPTTIEMSR